MPSLAVLCLLAPSLVALSLVAQPRPVAADASGDEPSAAAGVPLSAAFYNDASCLLTIDEVSRVGRTLIGANLGGDDSRTLIHCDTRDGRRLTLLARGEQLQRDARIALLPREGIEGGTDGVIAWLTRAGTTFADESAPRRYVAPGHVIIRELPTLQVDGEALNGDRTAFARMEGKLEKLLSHPGGGETNSPPDCPAERTRRGPRPASAPGCQP